MIETAIANLSVRRLTSARRSTHQQMVDAFMHGASQELPSYPQDPGEEVRVLRAKLIFEEAMETINGLGVAIVINGCASMAIAEGQEFQTLLNQPYEPNSRFVADGGEKLDKLERDESDEEDPDNTLAGKPYWTDGDLEFGDRDGLPCHPSGEPLAGKLLEEDEGCVAEHSYHIAAPMNLREVVDGCLDIKVVTTGTLSACGVADEALQFEVDSNNLRKFAEGHTIRDDGKLVKPPNHPKPRIQELLDTQCEKCSAVEK